jgi:hypothetical protein
LMWPFSWQWWHKKSAYLPFDLLLFLSPFHGSLLLLLSRDCVTNTSECE